MSKLLYNQKEKEFFHVHCAALKNIHSKSLARIYPPVPSHLTRIFSMSTKINSKREVK